MKKLDPEKLRNAFDIPDPERKKEFLASYGDKFISRKKSCKKLALPRFAPAMALAVLFVCLLGVMKQEHDLRKNVGTDNIIIETTDTSTTAIVTTTEDPPVRTTTTARSSEAVLVSSTTNTVSTKSDVTVTSAVTAITETDKTTDFTENTSTSATTAKTTATTTRKSTSKTTSSTAKQTTTIKLTSKTVAITLSTSQKTTSSKSDIPVTTSENDGMVSVITTTKITSVSGQDGMGIPTCDNVDYSVVPDIIYTPTDNIYETDTDRPCGTAPVPDEFFPDLVINGTIVDMIFTRIDNQPYTQFNVVIDRFITGDKKFKNGDTISIYVKGGCMPAREFFELFPNNQPYDLEITDDLTVFDAGELTGEYYPGKQRAFKLDKSNLHFPENTFIIHKS